MKSIYFFLCMISLSQRSIAQDFSFQMYFADAIGNMDTLILGYDMSGTDTIDLGFGETNILTTSLDSLLDVRITDGMSQSRNNQAATFHTKRQILKNECPGSFSIVTIDIATKNWPVTATWDSSQFMDSCRVGSIFIGVDPGGWFDVSSPSELERTDLAFTNSVTFSTNSPSSLFFNENYAYINTTNDTIPVFWFTFASEFSLIDDVHEPRFISIDVFPNPTTDFINIVMEDKNHAISKVQVFDISGKEQIVLGQVDMIDLRYFPKGMYFLQITTFQGHTITKKVCKL